MTRIAGTFGDRCVERGVSTMRRALGYNSALPEGWNEGPLKLDYDIPDLLPLAFPGRAIQVWHSDKGFFEGLRSDLWEYMGDGYNTTPESDEWLTAFCYENKAGTAGHFVIGGPVVYDGVQIALIIAVSLEVTGGRWMAPEEER